MRAVVVAEPRNTGYLLRSFMNTIEFGDSPPKSRSLSEEPDKELEEEPTHSHPSNINRTQEAQAFLICLSGSEAQGTPGAKESQEPEKRRRNSSASSGWSNRSKKNTQDSKQ